jgi:hypothetical protein
MVSYLKVIFFSKLVVKNFNINFKIFFISIMLLSINNSYNSDCMSYKDMLSLIVGSPINMNEMLEKYIYRYTNKIVTRDILTMPIGLYNNEPYAYQDKIGLNLFYSGISQGVYFNNNLTGINNVVDVGDLTQQINDIFESLFSSSKFASANFPLIGDLFENIIIRQQRLGGVIQGGYNLGNFCVYAQIPLEYQIQYIFATPEAQSKLTDELDNLVDHGEVYEKLNNDCNGDSDSSLNFIKETMVADYFGLDRSVLGLVYKNICESPASLEFRIFTPGLDFKKGLIGGNYSNVANQKSDFNFVKFLQGVLSDKNSTCYDAVSSENSFENIFKLMLSRVTDATYNVPFSSKSWAFSPSLILSFDLGKGFYFDSYLTYIYSIPNEQTKYGYKSINPKLYNINYAEILKDDAPQSYAYDTLNFFGEQFKERILLEPFSVIVDPGWELQYNFALVTLDMDTSTRCGFDIWYKSAETFSGISLIDFESNNLKLNYTNTCSAIQGKVFAGLETLKDFCCLTWFIGARIDATVFSNGIGKEFGFSINLETLF